MDEEIKEMLRVTELEWTAMRKQIRGVETEMPEPSSEVLHQAGIKKHGASWLARAHVLDLEQEAEKLEKQGF